MRATCKPRLVRKLAPHDGLYEIEPGHSLGERIHIDVRPGRRFERSTQKRRAQSRRKKLQALKSKKHAAQRIGIGSQPAGG